MHTVYANEFIDSYFDSTFVTECPIVAFTQLFFTGFVSVSISSVINQKRKHNQDTHICILTDTMVLNMKRMYLTIDVPQSILMLLHCTVWKGKRKERNRMRRIKTGVQMNQLAG